MKRALTKIVPVVLILSLVFSFTAFADTGPKPSVVIELVGLDGRECYGTLLSYHESYGPNRAWKEGEEMYAYHEDDPGIWRKFVDYKDSDGYYFLQQFWNCTENEGFKWGYYPPDPFKLLLYFPETDTFAVTPIYERYAFDSYYTVDVSKVGVKSALEAVTQASSNELMSDTAEDLQGVTEPTTEVCSHPLKNDTATTENKLLEDTPEDLPGVFESETEVCSYPLKEDMESIQAEIQQSSTEPSTVPEELYSVTDILLHAEESYDYKWEIISLVARIAITLALEIAVALIFGFKKKNLLGFITAVNVITQIALNLILFSVDINHGSMAFTAYYVFLEICVFAVEAVAYSLYIRKKQLDVSKKKAVVYALAANVLSFGAGLGLAHIIPGIF
ncbi:MAG: hypothetical protein IJN38_02630 [Clostridia bacterium]|nr:hypothetical protein [Clostridia bacterium]